MTRAIRRHHLKRIKEEAIRKKKYGRDRDFYLKNPEILGKNVSCRAMCSCRACGNARNTEKGEQKLTIQERSFNQINKDSTS